MKRLNKVLSLVLAVLFSLALFTGCGEDSKNAEGTSRNDQTAGQTTEQAAVKPVQLKIWGGVPAEYGPDATCEEFNKQYLKKGISASYERYVNDESGNLKLDTALLSGIDVDVFITHSIPMLKKRVEAGMALELTQSAEKDGFDFEKNFGPLVKEYFINDKSYSVPTYAFKYSLMVNKDIFDANNIPVPTAWTIDEFRDICKKLTKGTGNDKKYGAFISFDSQKYFPAYVVGTKTGGDFFYKDGKDQETDFDNPTYNKVLQAFVDMMLVDKSIVSYTDIVTQKLTAINMFISEKVAICDAYWVSRDIKNREKYPHTFKTAFVPMPTVDKVDREEAYIQGGYGDYLCINSKTQNIDQAWEFVKWYSTGGMMPMVPFGRIPACLGIDKNVVADSFSKGAEDLFDMDSFKNEILRTEKMFQVSKVYTKLPEITKIAEEEFEMAYIGKKDTAAALSEAKKRGDEILKK